MAIDFELNSVSFYREIAEVIQDPEDKGSVQELERQEKEHAAQLLEIRQKMTE
jgi:rubrerythrin